MQDEKKGKAKTKISLDEEISKVIIKSIEQECLNRVFDRLCDLGKYSYLIIKKMLNHLMMTHPLRGINAK